MARNMIDANATVFLQLDEYARSVGPALLNEGSPRWIKTEAADRAFLKDSLLQEYASLGFGKLLGHFVFASESYVAAIGVSQEFDFSTLLELDVTGAHATAILAELRPRPIATSAELLDIVAASDKNADKFYTGHDVDLVLRLYPDIRLFKLSGGKLSDPWNVFFCLSLLEAKACQHWPNDELLTVLDIVSNLDPSRIPYRVLCRSIFDADEASFFLALYRCLEALYSYSATIELMSDLGLAGDWRAASKSIEDRLGWYPREETALERLLGMASAHDLLEICKVLNVPTDTMDSIVQRSSKALYRLRNQCVHYRPSHQEVDLKAVDWNSLCVAMAAIVLDVYQGVT